jgi:hypothetical protein
VISLKKNTLTSVDFRRNLFTDIKADPRYIASLIPKRQIDCVSLGTRDKKIPYIFNFYKLLKSTDFPVIMREMLALLSKVYDYPVDIEFTAKLYKRQSFQNPIFCNAVRCRQEAGKSIEIQNLIIKANVFFPLKGNFMGGNVRLPN